MLQKLDGSARRNTKQSDKRKAMDDHKCIALGTANPDVAHIIPFSFNSTAQKVEWLKPAMRNVVAFLIDSPLGNSADAHMENIQLLLTSKVDVSDRL